MIEVLKQMLEALEWCHGGEPIGTAEAIVAGKQAIAELESQKPVGRFAQFTDNSWRKVTDGSPGVPLYTHPPQHTWVDLTQQELDELDEQSPSLHDFVQNLMSKLKEKNT